MFVLSQFSIVFNVSAKKSFQSIACSGFKIFINQRNKHIQKTLKSGMGERGKNKLNSHISTSLKNFEAKSF